MSVILEINKDGQTQPWWFNFLNSFQVPRIVNDLEIEFAKWNAKVLIDKETQLGNSVQFESEQDMAWFLLRWS